MRWDVLDLARLSFVTRSTLAVLMLLPVAVVCTLAARRLIEVRSFGTFTPALLGLAATALDWRSTLVVFALVALGVMLLLGSFRGKRLSDTVGGRWLGETRAPGGVPGS